jgi:hypothetical protein
LGTALYGVSRFTILNEIYPNQLGTATGVTMAAGDLGTSLMPPAAGFYRGRGSLAVRLRVRRSALRARCDRSLGDASEREPHRSVVERPSRDRRCSPDLVSAGRVTRHPTTRTVKRGHTGGYRVLSDVSN